MSCEKPSKSRYSAGCRCDACRAENTRACRESRERVAQRKGQKATPYTEGAKEWWRAMVSMGRASICPVCGQYTKRDEGMCVLCENTR